MQPTDGMVVLQVRVGEKCIMYRAGVTKDQTDANWLRVNLAGNKKYIYIFFFSFPFVLIQKEGFVLTRKDSVSGIPEGWKCQDTELLLLVELGVGYCVLELHIAAGAAGLWWPFWCCSSWRVFSLKLCFLFG